MYNSKLDQYSFQQTDKTCIVLTNYLQKVDKKVDNTARFTEELDIFNLYQLSNQCPSLLSVHPLPKLLSANYNNLSAYLEDAIWKDLIF